MRPVKGCLCTLIRTLKPARTRRTWPEPTATTVLSRTPPEGCRDSGMRYQFRERFVPHLALLQRAVLMVSHAGHGSVMKGLWSGIPMVLVPWGRDQPGVAARAQRMGTARIVEPSALDELPHAIDAVLRMPTYAEAALRHRERIRAGDPVSRACDLVEQSASADARGAR